MIILEDGAIDVLDLASVLNEVRTRFRMTATDYHCMRLKPETSDETEATEACEIVADALRLRGYHIRVGRYISEGERR